MNFRPASYEHNEPGQRHPIYQQLPLVMCRPSGTRLVSPWRGNPEARLRHRSARLKGSTCVRLGALNYPR